MQTAKLLVSNCLLRTIYKVFSAFCVGLIKLGVLGWVFLAACKWSLFIKSGVKVIVNKKKHSVAEM